MREPFLGWVSKLVHEHRARLVKVARKEGVDGEDALDCVQEAFRGFLCLPTARVLVNAPDDSIKLLTVLTRNQARNRRKKHDRARPHSAEPLETIPADAPSAEKVVAQAEAYVAMVGCVATLTEVQRRVVTLRLLDEVAGEDVARLLGLEEGHVAVLLHRAKDTLRRCVV
jgi:RNA polymerase sigma-70 factor (ECF subfamily)